MHLAAEHLKMQKLSEIFKEYDAQHYSSFFFTNELGMNIFAKIISRSLLLEQKRVVFTMMFLSGLKMILILWNVR